MSAPLPPSDLDSRNPELPQLPAGTIIHRFYTREYEPFFFDPGLSGRLNAPDGSYGVCEITQKPIAKEPYFWNSCQSSSASKSSIVAPVPNVLL